jgi:spermidine/putrescine-binding protein
MFYAPILYLRNGRNKYEIITICNVKVAKMIINAYIEPINMSRMEKKLEVSLEVSSKDGKYQYYHVHCLLFS